MFSYRRLLNAGSQSLSCQNKRRAVVARANKAKAQYCTRRVALTASPHLDPTTYLPF